MRESHDNSFTSEKADHSQDLVHTLLSAEVTQYSGSFLKYNEEPAKQSALRHSEPHEEIKAILECSSAY